LPHGCHKHWRNAGAASSVITRQRGNRRLVSAAVPVAEHSCYAYRPSGYFVCSLSDGAVIILPCRIPRHYPIALLPSPLLPTVCCFPGIYLVCMLPTWVERMRCSTSSTRLAVASLSRHSYTAKIPSRSDALSRSAIHRAFPRCAALRSITTGWPPHSAKYRQNSSTGRQAKQYSSMAYIVNRRHAPWQNRSAAPRRNIASPRSHQRAIPPHCSC